MDLFTSIVKPEHQHPNFNTVANVLRRPSELAVVSEWAEGFPDRDGKFVQEFQRTFNSSFWELYLHGLFKAYGFQMNWTHPRPDFWLETPQGEVIVEAVTANEAAGMNPEWVRSPEFYRDLAARNFWPLNRNAIIRLASALLSKVKKYQDSYRHLSHVPRKPFVIAVAPFDQPLFNHQYDRPIQALLYDHYVDETAYYRNPDRFPSGPPSVRLGSVEKDNGAEILMGLFNDEQWTEVSAVVFSCTATWGKAVAMSIGPRPGEIHSSWGVGELGAPEKRVRPVGVPSEHIADGLMVFHNHYARNPLPWETFRRRGVAQWTFAPDGPRFEGRDQSLQFRFSQQFDRESRVLPQATNDSGAA